MKNLYIGDKVRATLADGRSVVGMIVDVTCNERGNTCLIETENGEAESGEKVRVYSNYIKVIKKGEMKEEKSDSNLPRPTNLVSEKNEFNKLREVPWLVQRLILKDKENQNAKGIDCYFSMDYMGSAEFEFGMLGFSLRMWREYLACSVEKPECIKLESGEVCWFVGDATRYDQAKEFFADQLNEKKWSLKEGSRIQFAYKDAKYMYDFVGWWALDANLPWAIFKTKEHANLFLKGLKNKEGKV